MPASRRTVSKASMILALHAQGLSTRNIAVVALDLHPDARGPLANARLAYVRAVIARAECPGGARPADRASAVRNRPRRNALRRKRYALDPTYRKTQLKRSQAWFKGCRKSPRKWGKYLARQRQRQRHYRLKKRGQTPSLVAQQQAPG